MADQEKSKEQLIQELTTLRRRVAKLEALEDAHKKTETQLAFQAQLLDSVRESVVATDMDGNIIYWGKGAEALYGYTAKETMGRHVASFIVSDEERPEEEERMRQVHQTGMWRGQYIQQRKDGSSFWADTVLSLVTDAGGQPVGIIGIDRDITGRKQTDDKVSRHSREMAMLFETSLEINSQPDLNTLLHAIIRRATELLQTQQGGLFLMQPGQETLELVVVYNQPDAYLGTQLKVGEGLSGRVAQAKQPISIPDYSRWAHRSDALAQHTIRRILGVPLIRGNQVIGVINVIDNEKTGEFDEADIRLLSLFATQAAIAIENARLFEEAHRRAQELTLLNKLAREMTGPLETQELFNTVVQAIARQFGYFNAAILTPEFSSKTLRLRAVSGDYANKFDPNKYRQPLDQGIIGQAATTGQIIINDNLRQDPHFYTPPDLNVRSEIAIPLTTEDQVIGVLVVSSEQINAFDPNDVATLTTIADQLIAAMERTRLFDETRQHARQMEVLQQVSQDVTALRDLDTLLYQITEHAIHLLNREAGGISLYRPERDVLEWMVEAGEKLAPIGFTLKRGEGLGGKILATRQPAIIDDYQMWPGKTPRRPNISGSIVGVPIQWGETFLGVLTVVDSSKRPFTPEDAALLSQFATQAAIAIQNARLHQETQTQARQVQQILDSVQEGILLLDTGHRVQLANPAAQEYLALLSKATIGDPLTRLGTQSLTTILSDPDGDSWHEIKLTHPAPRIFEVAARPVKSASQAEGWVMVLRDVTQERTTQTRIQRQERLAAVGQLAAGIAHDFNNILTSIIGYAELAHIAPDVPDLVKDDMKRVVQQGQRAANLIRQILDFSRQSMIEKRSLDLAPFIKEMVRLLERTLPENLRLTLEIDSTYSAYRLKADPGQIQQALTNLAVNARDAMPQGGLLQFKLSAINLQPNQPPPCPELPPGHWIALSITDTGAGIAPEIHPHLFEPFFTTKEVGQGTGLGLAQVYGIIKQHEGYIDVQSQVNQGTTFTLYLPLLNTPQPEDSAGERTKIPTGQGQTILLVEDDKAVLAVTQSMLKRLGYRVLTATNGQEALEYYHQTPNEIALILTDIAMPDMSGIALSQTLRRQNASINVVALTGYPLEAQTNDLAAQGIVDWLQKPLKLEKLAQTIQKALQQ